MNPSPFLMQQKNTSNPILSELPKKIMKNKDKLLNKKDNEFKYILKSICYYKLVNASIKI